MIIEIFAAFEEIDTLSLLAMIRRPALRFYSTGFSLKRKPDFKSGLPSVHPKGSTRTRFAPSPTGFLHLGSLRTALYNFLLAKNTGGQFLLRLEDTDRNRLVQGAEENIYETLKWCGIKIDEGPNEGGQYGPYRQSDRKEIYKAYADLLVAQGKAYYCHCSKERLNSLRESAAQFRPPTTVSYDRQCYKNTDPLEGKVIRFISPDVYDPFIDLLHGNLDLQPQYNYADRRYDDFVIMKSDGLPTYHFANVVDDHLMKITHVVRGEEWLPSTPKHIALYKAFGWEPPSYVHIPLLTSLEDKKLSKRSGNSGILELKDDGFQAEAIVNFVALFGWSPPRAMSRKSAKETMKMNELISSFSLDNLTKGNAKVNDSKLYFFNKYHIGEKVKSQEGLSILVEDLYPRATAMFGDDVDRSRMKRALKIIGSKISTTIQLLEDHLYIFEVNHSKVDSLLPKQTLGILSLLVDLPLAPIEETVNMVLLELPECRKKDVFETIRLALAGGASGLTIPNLIEILGEEETKKRIEKCIKLCTN